LHINFELQLIGAQFYEYNIYFSFDVPLNAYQNSAFANKSVFIKAEKKIPPKKRRVLFLRLDGLLWGRG
jgi:hypothetical protein